MMRPFMPLALVLALVLTASSAQARDTEYKLKFDEVLSNPTYKSRLGDDVAFYFAGQKAPAVAQSLGEWVTNKKTNSAGKPDEEACRWAMLSALLELRERARKLEGNAVTNIVSYYKKVPFASDTEYECHRRHHRRRGAQGYGGEAEAVGLAHGFSGNWR